MHVKYTGPGAGRDIRMPDGREVHADKGKQVEVPDAVGKSLTKQRYWEEVKTKAAPKAADEPEAPKGGK